MDNVFSPVIALPIYIGLVSILVFIGQRLAEAPTGTADSSLYSSGEEASDEMDKSVPGYRPFFLVALFFAILHLGVVVLATSTMSIIAIIYLLGLMMALLALILG